MEQKIKVIAVVLGIAFLLALLAAFSYYGRWNTLNRDYQELDKQKHISDQSAKDFSRQLDDAKKEVRDLTEREESINKALERRSSELENLQSRFNELTRERSELVEKLQQALTKGVTIQSTASSQDIGAATDQYWANILKEKANLELELSNLKNSLKDGRIRADELTRDKVSLDLEAQKLTKEKTDIQRKLEYNERMVNSLSLQLVREKDDKRKIEAQALLLKEENYSLRSRLREIMNNKVSLERKLKDTDDKRMELYNRLNRMDQLLQDRLSEVLDTKQDLSDIKKGTTPSSGEAVELSPIVVRSLSANENTPSKEVVAPLAAAADIAATGNKIRGKVLSLNEENSFVILDVGENQGVKKGEVLHVYQGQRPVATLEVIQVRANVCAADIKEKTADIKVGNIIIN